MLPGWREVEKSRVLTSSIALKCGSDKYNLSGNATRKKDLNQYHGSQALCSPLQNGSLLHCSLSWLPDGDSQIFRSYVFCPSGFWTMTPLHSAMLAAKFDPLEGIKFCHLATLLSFCPTVSQSLSPSLQIQLSSLSLGATFLFDRPRNSE